MRPLELALPALLACHQTPEEPEAGLSDPIGWVEASAATHATVAKLPAAVVVPQTTRWVAGPPVPARLIAWSVADGDRVVAGQPLATLISPELGDLAAGAAALDRVVAERSRNVERLARAVEAGFRSAEELYTAELALCEAEAERGRTRRQLSGRGDSVRSKAGSQWEWLAPTSGQIISLACSPGGLYDAASGCLTIVPEQGARVAAHLSAPLLAALAESIRAGEVSAQWAPEGGAATTLALERCLPGFEPHSRTRSCLFGGAGLQVGAAGTFSVEVPPPAGAARLPRQAVVQLDGQDTVFLQAEPPRPQPVTVLGRQGADAIVAGLAPGAVVAGRGAFTLKSRLALQ